VTEDAFVKNSLAKFIALPSLSFLWAIVLGELQSGIILEFKPMSPFIKTVTMQVQELPYRHAIKAGMYNCLEEQGG